MHLPQGQKGIQSLNESMTATCHSTRQICWTLQAKLLEHNVRFGDPECQGLMLRLESDLLEVLLAACDGKLADVKLQWSPDAALTVVMAAKGYPGSYQKGSIIQGLDKVSTAKVGSQSTTAMLRGAPPEMSVQMSIACSRHAPQDHCDASHVTLV